MKILKYLIICTSLFILCCKKDKSNYDYIALDEFALDTVGLQSSYSV